MRLINEDESSILAHSSFDESFEDSSVFYHIRSDRIFRLDLRLPPRIAKMLAENSPDVMNFNLQISSLLMRINRVFDHLRCDDFV